MKTRDGSAVMSIVSESSANFDSNWVPNTNDHFEHLTCFVGGLLVLGARLGEGAAMKLWRMLRARALH